MPPSADCPREQWERVADGLLDAVIPYATPDFAQIRLPGRTSCRGLLSDGLEGYARTFLLAAFRIAGARGAVPPALIERYADGLAAGTDPAHPYAWPEITDRSQPMVEAASIALGLAETRPWLYDRLAPEVQQRVLDWLAGIIGKQTYPCNWVLFTAIVEQFLAGAGGPARHDEIAAALAEVERWYVGDGWYTDGAGQHYDYYGGWAIHLYSMLWARMAGDGTASAVYRRRLRAFLDSYQHFFAADGAPLHQGRSLTYRFATVAPLWLGALVDATPLPPGRTRLIAGRVLRHFADRGAPDSRGLLTLGWHRPFLPVTQEYSGPASPYWASKAFLGLLLPADHPVWTAPAEDAPIDTGDRVLALPGPGWLLHYTRRDGVVRLANHGSDGSDPAPAPAEGDPHYVKLGYASHAAPETGTPARQWDVDGHLAVLPPDGVPQAVPPGVAGMAGVSPGPLGLTMPPGPAGVPGTRRRRIERIGVYDRFAASQYTDRLPDGAPVTVRTASMVHAGWEFRVHRVRAPGGSIVREGGYALAGQRPPDVAVHTLDALVTTPDGLTGALIGLAGWTDADVLRCCGSNAYGARSATPYLYAVLPPGGLAYYVSLLALTREPVRPGDIRDAIKVTVDGDLVRLDVPGGETLEVCLGDEPWYARRTPGEPAVVWP